MVQSIRSQIFQFTERFFHQSWLLNIYHHTRCSIDWFLVFDLKFRYMEKIGAKSKKLALTYIGEFLYSGFYQGE
jgi:hypothetical protein